MKDPKELADAISRFVNGASIDKLEELANLMVQDHPTLQQSKMKLACLFIEKMAEKQHVDARNSSSKKIAVDMIEGFRKEAKQEIINQDGCISDSLNEFMDKAVPSKSLPTI